MLNISVGRNKLNRSNWGEIQFLLQHKHKNHSEDYSVVLTMSTKNVFILPLSGHTKACRSGCSETIFISPALSQA